MSATHQEIPQPQGIVGYKKPPKEHQFKVGKSGNPGGTPKAERVDIAYKKLISLSVDELATFEPKTGAELLAFRQYTKAISNGNKETLAYAQEVTNRTDGVLASKVELNVTVDLRAVQVEALLLMYATTPKETLIERGLAAIEAVYAASGEDRRSVIEATMEASDEELGQFWADAEAKVKANGK